jgi:biotin-dependent carboxylase-like uncharacterized protein
MRVNRVIEVLRPGLCDLVMDDGRHAFAHLGVPVGGAADRLALTAANRLVGNPDMAAGLEITLSGPTLVFPEGGVVALTGARFAASRSSEAALDWNETLILARGEHLSLGHAQTGCRCWLAVRGGLAVPRIMGSRSTFLPSGFGGKEGRTLRAGDVLVCGVQGGEACLLRYKPHALDLMSPLRVIPGPQTGHFTDVGLAAFFAGPYRVDSASDRRGLRLMGVPVAALDGGELPSQGVLPGAVQIPPDGQPIVLGWDGPVTGGYPVIAGVIAADLGRLAQLLPGDSVRFVTETPEAAQAEWRARWAVLECETGDRGQGTGDRGQGTGDRGQGTEACAARLFFCLLSSVICPLNRQRVRQQGLNFTLLIHLDHDVATPNQFPFDVKLGESRPVGVVLQVLENFRVGQYIHRQEIVYAAGLQDLGGFGRKSALRKLGRAFHVKHNGIAGNLFAYAV